MKNKRCTKCNKLKLLSEFYNNKNGRSWCISCFRKLSLENYRKHKEEYKIRLFNWRKSNREKFNENQKEYRKNNPEVIKVNPTHRKATSAVQHAVYSGELLKPTKCSNCHKENKIIHGHHWHGYKKEYWLDVQWLCPKCHKEIEYSNI
jgi:hypothetical protein